MNNVYIYTFIYVYSVCIYTHQNEFTQKRDLILTHTHTHTHTHIYIYISHYIDQKERPQIAFSTPRSTRDAPPDAFLSRRPVSIGMDKEMPETGAS